MATYKVIQDIEAEDTIIGWMTPRQAIYAAIVIVSGFIGFLLSVNGVWWLAIPLLPHMILFTVLSGPFVHDQPSEVWLLAKIQFFLKPRKRIWDQNGLKELVTITVPKKVERHLTDGLTQNEVKSRLHALANTIDSRGWAVKNVNVNLYAQPGYATAGITSDRLIDTAQLPQEVPNYEVTAQDDILDEHSNPTALHLQRMIDQSTQSHRQQIMTQMQQGPTATPVAAQPADYWFLNANAGQQLQSQPGYATFDHNPTVTPGSSTPIPTQAVQGPSQDDQDALLRKIRGNKKHKDPSRSHLRTINPLSAQTDEPPAAVQPAPQPNPVVQQFANNDDLNISTIARQANKATAVKNNDDNEVVISLR